MGRRSKAEWLELLEDFEARQIGQEKYCRERELSLSAFRNQLYAWRRTRSAGIEPKSDEFVMVSTGWPTINRAKKAGTAVILTIGGFKLTVERTCDPAALRLAMQALAETCGRI
jgi:hypothetical protein